MQRYVKTTFRETPYIILWTTFLLNLFRFRYIRKHLTPVMKTIYRNTNIYWRLQLSAIGHHAVQWMVLTLHIILQIFSSGLNSGTFQMQ